jgi:methylmalonyl-CoA/ethylmalonyl-CoA epimerase
MPHDVPIRVDHVGIAVESVASAEPVLLALGCEKLLDETVEDRFRWMYYRLGDASRVELLEPVAEDTFLTDFLETNGPGLHHVTLEVADVDAVVASLEDAGLSVVDRRTFEDWTEAFVSPRNPTGTLFQLMEYHGGWSEGRLPPEELYVNGGPVEAAAGDSSPRPGRYGDEAGGGEME